jgi:hypothetical protein
MANYIALLTKLYMHKHLVAVNNKTIAKINGFHSQISKAKNPEDFERIQDRIKAALRHNATKRNIIVFFYRSLPVIFNIIVIVVIYFICIFIL